MYTTSAAFKTAINNSSRNFECKIICGSKTYTNADIVDIKVEGGLQPSGYTIGSAVSQIATFKFINNGTITFPSNTISLQIGLLVNGVYEYVPIGVYTIDSHDSDDYTITIVTYDNMTKLESKYNGSETTLRALAQGVSNASGVELADSSSISDTTITPLAKGEYTCREIIGYIAGCMCGNAVIDRTGKLKIQKLNMSIVDKQVTTENWFTYKNADMIFNIKQLTCDIGNGVELESGYSADTDKQLTIKNPIMTQGMLDSAKAELNSVVFTGFDVSYQGDISADLGDTVKIIDRKGQTLIAPLLNRTISYNGGLTENIKTEGKKKIDVAGSYYGNGRYSSEFDKFNSNMNDMRTEIRDLSDTVASLESSNCFSYLIDVVGVSRKVRVSTVGTTTRAMKVDWGNGEVSSSTGGSVEHNYRYSGSYTVKIFPSDVKNCTTPKGADLIKILELPDGLENMDDAFAVSLKLTECCPLPNTVRSCKSTFRRCKSLTTMASFGNSGDVDCTRMYEECTSLVNCTPINDDTTICDYMFYECKLLRTPPAFGESVKSCVRMFYNCSNLTHTPVFTENVEDITYMFYGCTSLTKAYPMGDLSKATDGYYTFQKCKALETIPSLPSGLTSGYGMFEGCTSLTTIPELPNGILTGHSMFRGCTLLSTVPNLPTALTDGRFMFNNCYALTEIPNLPDGITDGSDMFFGCRSLTEIPNMPSELINGDGMFHGCSSLTTIPNLPDGITSGVAMFSSCKLLGSIPNLPTALTSGDTMFNGCTSLTTIPDLPDGLTSVDNMFNGCTSLTTAPNLPDGITKGYQMFYRCSSLTTIPNLPENLENGAYMFYGCSSLTTIPSLPSGLTSGYDMFSYCTSLTTAPVLPIGLTNGVGMFHGCGLTTVPNLPSTIVNYGRMFRKNKITAIPGDLMAFMNANPDLGGMERGCFAENPITSPQPYADLIVSSKNPSYRWFRA